MGARHKEKPLRACVFLSGVICESHVDTKILPLSRGASVSVCVCVGGGPPPGE